MSDAGQNQLSPGTRPKLSVVVPVKDEADNVLPLIREICAALESFGPFEIVYVDDGSSDATPANLVAAQTEAPMLRIVTHDGCFGQSAAVRSGVNAARAPLIATLDGDGQNDPADIPALAARFETEGGDGGSLLLIAGWRAKRRDTWVKRMSSKIANAVRGGLLGDATPDTGCGLKVFPRAMFLNFPAFRHMHRFLPALTIRAGGQVFSVHVNHRPRERGTSKYGVMNRLWVGIADLFGVMWLQRRPMRVAVKDTTEPRAQ